MPVSKITMNFPLEDEAEFANDFHRILQDTLEIPEYDRLVIINQKTTGFYIPTNTQGTYLLFEISLFSGRSQETKKKLYQQLIQFAFEYSVEAENVRIILNEVPKENWAIRGGQMASEIALGFNTSI